MHVGRVLYGHAATEARHRNVIENAAAITSKVAWTNRSLGNTVRPSDYFIAMAREVIATQLIWNCLTAKRDNFQSEREVRYIIMNVAARFDAHRKSFKNRPYVETPVPLKAAGNIMEILVGPRSPEGAEAIVRHFLQANDYQGDIPVSRSNAASEPFDPTAAAA